LGSDLETLNPARWKKNKKKRKMNLKDLILINFKENPLPAKNL